VRKFVIVFVAILFAAALLSFMFFYNVRFTEVAVLTRFGKASGDAIKEPGLRFKLPYPIDNVTKYDTRTRVLPVKLETQPTADNRQVIIEAFCTWRVSDPLKFFQRFSNAGERADEHYAAAESALKSNLRSAMALISRYRMSELFNEKEGGTKLPEVEAKALQAFKGAADQKGLSLADYGVEATGVGISRVVLPDSTTSAVFEAMKTRRERLAKETQSKAEAEAAAIKSKADADAKRILAFADRRARDIRRLGELEAQPYLAEMNQNADLAVFLGAMDMMKTTLSKRTTLVMSSSMPGIQFLYPDAMEGLKPGEVPTLNGKRKSAISDMIDGGKAKESVKPGVTPRTSTAAPAVDGGQK
jgi:membrane protease subunit HflC